MDPQVVDTLWAAFQTASIPRPPQPDDSIPTPDLDTLRFHRTEHHPLLIALERRAEKDALKLKEQLIRKGGKKPESFPSAGSPTSNKPSSSASSSDLFSKTAFGGDDDDYGSSSFVGFEDEQDSSSFRQLFFGSESQSLSSPSSGSSSAPSSGPHRRDVDAEAVSERAVRFSKAALRASATALRHTKDMVEVVKLVKDDLDQAFAKNDDQHPELSKKNSKGNGTRDWFDHSDESNGNEVVEDDEANSAAATAFAEALRSKHLLPRQPPIHDRVASESKFASTQLLADQKMNRALKQAQRARQQDATASAKSGTSQPPNALNQSASMSVISEDDDIHADNQADTTSSPSSPGLLSSTPPSAQSNPADEAMLLNSLVSSASISLRQREWASLKQILANEGVTPMVLDRLGHSIAAHAGGLHAMIAQLYRECPPTRRVETVAGVWKLFIVLLEQSQQQFDASVDEAIAQKYGGGSNIGNTEGASSAPFAASPSASASFPPAGVYDTRIQSLERQHRQYALKQMRTQHRQAQLLEDEEKKLTARVQMLRGIADAVESTTRAGSERQLAVSDELASHQQLASAIDQSVTALKQAVTQLRDRYYDRAKIFGDRKAHFDASNIRLADLKKMRVELQESLTSQRIENRNNNQRLISATAHYEELVRLSKSYQRQITTSKQQIAEGIVWNDEAQANLQLASMRNAPLYLELGKKIALREQAQQRLKQMSDVGVRLHLLEASLQDRLRMFQHTQQQADEQAQLMKQQVDMTLEMIAKASEQLEETMRMLSDTEDDLQALKTAHETLRKILKKQVDEAKKKQDELDAFGSQLEQAASESARLLQEYRLLYYMTQSGKHDLKQLTQAIKVRQAKLRLHQQAYYQELADLYRKQAQFELWHKRCTRLYEKTVDDHKSWQAELANLNAEYAQMNDEREHFSVQMAMSQDTAQRMKDDTNACKKEEVVLESEIAYVEGQINLISLDSDTLEDKIAQVQLKIQQAVNAIDDAQAKIDETNELITETKQHFQHEIELVNVEEQKEQKRLADLLAFKEKITQEHAQLVEELSLQQKQADEDLAAEGQSNNNILRSMTLERDALARHLQRLRVDAQRLSKSATAYQAQQQRAETFTAKFSQACATVKARLPEAQANTVSADDWLRRRRGIILDRQEKRWTSEQLQSKNVDEKNDTLTAETVELRRTIDDFHAWNRLRLERSDQEALSKADVRHRAMQYSKWEIEQLSGDPRNVIVPTKFKLADASTALSSPVHSLSSPVSSSVSSSSAQPSSSSTTSSSSSSTVPSSVIASQMVKRTKSVAANLAPTHWGSK